jgi:hypothetical protein
MVAGDLLNLFLAVAFLAAVVKKYSMLRNPVDEASAVAMAMPMGLIIALAYNALSAVLGSCLQSKLFGLWPAEEKGEGL